MGPIGPVQKNKKSGKIGDDKGGSYGHSRSSIEVSGTILPGTVSCDRNVLMPGTALGTKGDGGRRRAALLAKGTQRGLRAHWLSHWLWSRGLELLRQWRRWQDNASVLMLIDRCRLLCVCRGGLFWLFFCFGMVFGEGQQMSSNRRCWLTQEGERNETASQRESYHRGFTWGGYCCRGGSCCCCCCCGCCIIAGWACGWACG